MATNYPGALDSLTNPTATDTLDSVTVPHASQHTDINDAVEAIEGELGTNPKGAKATVKARLDDVDTAITGKVATTTTISTTAPLTGGGDLSANRTFAVSAASTSASGVVQLSDSTSTTSSVLAATPTAVKAAYDAAVASVQTTRTISTTAPLTGGGDLSANRTFAVSAASTSASGVVQLSDSTSTTSSVLAATPTAVKAAYDYATTRTSQVKKQSTNYIRTPILLTSSFTVSNQRAYYMPIYIDTTTTIDRLSILTGATFSGTATIRLGIYNDTNGLPSTVVLDAGTVSATAISTVYEITVSQSLAAGFYWLAFAQQGTAPTTGAYIGAPSSGSQYQNTYIMTQSAPAAAPTFGYFQNTVTGAFATATGTAIANSIPHVWARVA